MAKKWRKKGEKMAKKWQKIAIFAQTAASFCKKMLS
jgi:hypothetical protein